VKNKCPDHQLLSVYFDGELPSPWKEKMESHIAGCLQCARRLESYRNLSPVAAAGGAASVGGTSIDAARERVWRKLEPRVNGATHTPPAWRRRISVPLPAAAAAVLLVALAFVLAVRIMGTADNAGIAAGMTFAAEAELDMPGVVPVSNMEDVLQYLGNRDDGEIIILRLPESRSFVNYGEPAIIRAADYSRQSGRQMPGRR
jgi:anti-sigma factor RsiW